MGQGVLPGCAVVVRRPGDPKPLVLKPAGNYPGLLAGEDGSIWSWLGRKSELVERKCRFHTTTKSVPRRYVTLQREGRRRPSVAAYKIVADAWLGPADGMDVDHKDGDPLNDSAGNLQYLEPAKNIAKGSRAEELSDDDWEDMLDA